MEWEDFIWGLVLTIVIASIIMLAVSGAVDRENWLDEHCTVTGKMSGSIGVGVNTGKDGGVVPTYIPGKTQYQCDDGLTYLE